MAKCAYLLLFGLVFSTIARLHNAKKDILFFAVDDLRPQLSFYGEDAAKTPNLDALAAKSMVFERAYCQVAICSPSRASLLTGRRPDTNHVWKISGDEYWRNFTNATTIPQYFKENGYRSIGMGKIFHPGPPSGNDDIKYSWSLPYFHGKDNVHAHESWYSFENAADNELMDGQIADNAVKTLMMLKENRTKGDDTPFFLAVGFHKPHLPFWAPSKYYDMYPPASEIALPMNPDVPTDMPPIAMTASRELRGYPDMKKYNLPECRTNATAAMSKECSVADPDKQLLRRAYHACQSFTDAQIGKVLNEMENQGLANDTIVVVWGDHGWKLGEHNMWTKKTNFEVDARVPFLVRVPGVTDSGMRTNALVELIDIFPSLTELAGIDAPPLCPENSKDMLTCVEGSSVAPLLKNPDQEWKKAAFSQFPRPYYGLSAIPNKPPFQPSNEQEDVMGYAIRVDTYRFVEWYSFDRKTAKPDLSNVWGTELYDHTTPTKFFNDENKNLAKLPEMTEKVQELRKMLLAGWRAAMPPEKEK